MSATPEVFKAYVMRVLDGDLGAVAHVTANYAAALNDVDTYHRYFTEVLDLLYAQGCTCGERGQCSYCGWFDKRKGQR